MVSATAHRRQPAAARRSGYLIGAAVDAVLLYLINVRPGWEAVPFLTADTPAVLGLVNLSLTVGLVVYLVYVVADPQWVKALGDLVTTVISVAVLIRIWQVFPFSFATSFDWGTAVRVILVIAIFGTCVGALVAVVRLVRIAAGATVRS